MKTEDSVYNVKRLQRFIVYDLVILGLINDGTEWVVRGMAPYTKGVNN